MSRVLVVFLDGVGVGENDPATNPLAAAAAPAIRALLDGRRPVAGDLPYSGARASALGLDATLGVDGLPQSGTGQAALLTGVNAAQRFGRHFGPFTPTALRPLVESESMLARGVRDGLDVAFANAYPASLIALATGSGRLPLPLRSAIVIAAMGARVLVRHEPELIAGDAIASEITHTGWREGLGRTDVPEISAAQAGRNLAAIAERHDLTLFAHYATDGAGHLQDLNAGSDAWQRVDEFLGAVIGAMASDVLLAVVSDHGNLEDARVQHTRNPALCILAGPGHAALAERLSSLMDVAPALLGVAGAG
ncbi:MAG TPA: alkaline phosphatase family protein [Longimicrobiales bacterium]|nr:alkaline phosphatase family protein [Longimicrobiales bacterium]